MKKLGSLWLLGKWEPPPEDEDKSEHVCSVLLPNWCALWVVCGECGCPLARKGLRTPPRRFLQKKQEGKLNILVEEKWL